MMIVLLGFYKRHPDLDFEQFSDHWRNKHGPLLRDTREPRLAIRRYVQHHLRPVSDFGGGLFDFDGFSESWYHSIEDRKKLWSQEAWLEKIVPDERQFLDMNATRYVVADRPLTIIGDPTRVDGQVVTFF
jgi:hypothetical protein